VRLPWENLGGRAIHLRDLLAENEYTRSGDDLEQFGLYLDMPAWQVHAFEVTAG
jgi:hypothetical protein